MATNDNEQFGLGELPIDATSEWHLATRASHLPDVLTELNSLVELEIIRDYAIGGGYAVMYHGIPYSTFDLDVLVILGSEEDFQALYNHYRRKGNKIKDVYIYIADMAVQFLPNYISPLFDNAIKEAQRIRVSGVPSKVVRVEYLIALLLKAFRPKDKIHIIELAKSADVPTLNEILRRFDDERRLLSKRLEEVLGNP
ncbi:MAG: hypothetical protein PVJ08_00945 [Dehalococcoidia bacterium]|jgi:hypothetical protein